MNSFQQLRKPLNKSSSPLSSVIPIAAVIPAEVIDVEDAPGRAPLVCRLKVRLGVNPSPPFPLLHHPRTCSDHPNVILCHFHSRVGSPPALPKVRRAESGTSASGVSDFGGAEAESKGLKSGRGVFCVAQQSCANRSNAFIVKVHSERR